MVAVVAILAFLLLFPQSSPQIAQCSSATSVCLTSATVASSGLVTATISTGSATGISGYLLAEADAYGTTSQSGVTCPVAAWCYWSATVSGLLAVTSTTPLTISVGPGRSGYSWGTIPSTEVVYPGLALSAGSSYEVYVIFVSCVGATGCTNLSSQVWAQPDPFTYE